ncbi:DUF1062 domain-containing protein [Nocardia sp. NPDC051750]|uniref:DUF1062 domain-containing protein n=1 Tax=Nocardia sp. NPDC051750 TaxID=3364325 RepID=UPI0037BACF67
MLKIWVVVPTCLPLVLRRCHVCASERFWASGNFRVNANHKRIDAWLLALCTTCGKTTKLTVLERVNVRSIRPELLAGCTTTTRPDSGAAPGPGRAAP